MRSLVATYFAILLFATGCSTVTVRQPLGDKIAPEELKSLEGTWANPDGRTVEAHLTKSGQLAIGGVEWDEKKEEFRTEATLVIVTQSKDLKFLQLSNDPEKGYAFARWEKKDADTVLVYFPAVPFFEQAVTAGKLSGTIHRKKHDMTVELDAAPEKVLDFIANTGPEKCFEKEPSNSFNRIRSEK